VTEFRDALLKVASNMSFPQDRCQGFTSRHVTTLVNQNRDVSISSWI